MTMTRRIAPITYTYPKAKEKIRNRSMEKRKDSQGRPPLVSDPRLNSLTGPFSASCSDGVGDGVRAMGCTRTCGTISSLPDTGLYCGVIPLIASD